MTDHHLPKLPRPALNATQITLHKRIETLSKKAQESWDETELDFLLRNLTYLQDVCEEISRLTYEIEAWRSAFPMFGQDRVSGQIVRADYTI